MKKLIIVESPAKIKTISKFLGKDFKIMSTLGHIMDLPARKLGITMNKHIKLDYVVIEGKDQLIKDIVDVAKKAEDIYLAPDPDREGEIIAWHIGNQILDATGKEQKIHRISFNEITKSAIENALAHPHSIDRQMVEAQQARRVLDRWVGYEVSPILWRKIQRGLSAGRVQSVALRLICDREQAIRDFKPTEYWSIDALFDQKGAQLTAQLAQIDEKKAVINDKKEADSILDALQKADFVVTSIEDKKRSRSALPPFMTSTLQQAAFNQLGMAVKKTMQLAQNLYEGVPLEDKNHPTALITYMRTDSLRVADSAIAQVREYIEKKIGKNFLPDKANFYARKKEAAAQEAHEAVRPIDVTITPDYARKYLSPDHAKLYELIWKRFVASQMLPAEYAQRQVTIDTTNQKHQYTFKVTGSTLIFEGFLKVYNISEDEEKEGSAVIPKELKANQAIDLEKTMPKQHFTQAPPRYTEASLVKELEKEGIGRPSTYATIMNTIRARSYTTLDPKKRFVPTELGMTVTKMLVEHLPKIMDPKFTAGMEEDLDKIAEGQLKRDDLLNAFYEKFEKDLEKFSGQAKRTAEATDITCPECKKGKLLIRFGKSGSFLGCDKYPECSFTTNFTRKEDGTIELVAALKPELLDEKCPQCGKPLRRLMGKYGPFVACSGYPECKYIHQEKASFPCPLDGGDVIKRRWKGGTLWGCKNYPKCTFAIFGDIEQTPCPQCKSPYLIKKFSKTGPTILVCGNKECGYRSDGSVAPAPKAPKAASSKVSPTQKAAPKSATKKAAGKAKPAVKEPKATKAKVTAKKKS
jgi:DNA topoisomerase I